MNGTNIYYNMAESGTIKRFSLTDASPMKQRTITSQSYASTTTYCIPFLSVNSNISRKRFLDYKSSME